jgi:predicted RNase H-like HicB family nuclease
MTAHYHIDLFWWPEDESWVANVPDLPGCSAHGDTPEDAIREIQVAMELWLEVARDAGDPIPAPSYRSEVSTLAKAA